MRDQMIKPLNHSFVSRTSFALLVAYGGLTWPTYSQSAIDLPSNEITAHVDYDKAAYLSYFQVTLSGLPSTSSVSNGLYAGWCADALVDHMIDDNYRIYNTLSTLPSA